MRIGVFNSNGLGATKANLIDQFRVTENLDLLVVLETHFTQGQFTDSIFSQPLLNILAVRTLRRGRSSGGVLVLASRQATESAHIVLVQSSGQYAFFRIRDVVFGVGYFPPRVAAADLYFEEFL